MTSERVNLSYPQGIKKAVIRVKKDAKGRNLFMVV